MVWVFNGLAIAMTGVVSFLYIYGVDHSLFWYYVWYDAPLHVMGGMITGLWACAVAARTQMRLSRATLFLFGLALAVGVGWEVFELSVGLTVITDPGYWSDTLQDLLCDMGGAFIIWTLYWSIYRSRTVSIDSTV